MSKDRRSRPLWGRRISCWAGLLAAVTMTAAGCSGQQSVAHPDSQSSTVKVDPAHAALLRLPDGLTIRVPAGAVTRPGALSATVKGVPPVAAPSGMELTGPIYDLHLTGTTLRGDVTLSVPAPGPRQFGRTAGPDAALLAYFDPAGSWEPVNATYNAVTHVLTATTPHLSVWSVLRLNAASVLAAATDLLKGFFGKAGTGQPSCPLNAELAALRVQVTSDAGDLVKWCADDSGGQALIRIASNRSDALEADYPSNWLASLPCNRTRLPGKSSKYCPR